MTEGDGSYIIKPARIAEAQAIAENDVACWREAYESILPAPMLNRLSASRRAAQWRHVLARSETTGVVELFVAIAPDGGIVGHGSFGHQRSKSLKQAGFAGEIFALYLLRSAQRNGVGTRLMKTMMQSLADRDMTGCSLWVLEENIEARSFYRTLGGEHLAKRKELWQGLLVLPEVAYGWRSIGG